MYIKEYCNRKIESKILYNGTYDILSNETVILVYSEYAVPSNNDSNRLSGRCLTIFEREKKGIINDILSTNPKYNIVFSSKYEGSFDSLNYKNFEERDLDQDNKKEFMLTTLSRYADRTSEEWILITKDEDEWKIVSPDLSKIMENIKDITNKDVIFNGLENYGMIEDTDRKKLHINIDVFRFEDVLHQNIYYDVIGLEESGFFVSNPFNSALEVCYQFKCKDVGSFDADYIYIMQQYNNKKLFIDLNWNLGKPLLVHDELDFFNEYSDYWGIQSGDSIFYAQPDKEAE